MAIRHFHSEDVVTIQVFKYRWTLTDVLSIVTPGSVSIQHRVVHIQSFWVLSHLNCRMVGRVGVPWCIFLILKSHTDVFFSFPPCPYLCTSIQCHFYRHFIVFVWDLSLCIMIVLNQIWDMCSIHISNRWIITTKKVPAVDYMHTFSICTLADVRHPMSNRSGAFSRFESVFFKGKKTYFEDPQENCHVNPYRVVQTLFWIHVPISNHRYFQIEIEYCQSDYYTRQNLLEEYVRVRTVQTKLRMTSRIMTKRIHRFKTRRPVSSKITSEWSVTYRRIHPCSDSEYKNNPTFEIWLNHVFSSIVNGIPKRVCTDIINFWSVRHVFFAYAKRKRWSSISCYQKTSTITVYNWNSRCVNGCTSYLLSFYVSDNLLRLSLSTLCPQRCRYQVSLIVFTFPW